MNLLKAAGEGLALLPAAPEWALLLLKATVILALAAGAGFLLRTKHPRARIILWRATLGIVLALPLMAWGPRFEVPVARPAPAMVAEPVDNSLVAAPAPRINPVNYSTTSQPASLGKVSPPAAPRDWSEIFSGLALAIWLAGAILAGLRFRISLQQGRRLMANSRPANDSLALTGEQVARALGLAKPPAIRLSDEISCPLVAGVIRPTLLLPAKPGEEDTPGALSGILAHEISHLRGRDSQWQAAFGFLCVLLWFHPLAWLGAAAHIAACEESCDQAAADYVGSTEVYRRTLARVALAVRGRQPAGALPMARSPQILHRLEALKRRSKDFVLSRRAKVLLVAAGLAVLLGCGGMRTQLIGRAGLYEKAPAARNLQIKLGGNELRLDSVVRWNKRGDPQAEDGRGRVFGDFTGRPSELRPGAAWMDLADIHIKSAEPFAPLELRVFDHKTQQILSENPGIGCEIEGSTVHLRRLGQTLPESVDVWLRLENLPENGPVWQLPAETGARVNLAGPALSLREMRKGRWGYATSAGQIDWREQYSPDGTTAAFAWKPGSKDKARWRFQICAIDKAGKRFFPKGQAYLILGLSGSLNVMNFDLPLDQLSHFEIRPYEDTYRFYFPDVKLPKMPARGFDSPPEVIIPIKGKEGVFSSQALAPLRVTAQVLRGDRASGVASYAGAVHIQMTAEPTNPKTETTIVYNISGLGLRKVNLILRDKQGKELPDNGYSSYASFVASQSAGAGTLRTPLEKIDSIAFKLE